MNTFEHGELGDASLKKVLLEQADTINEYAHTREGEYVFLKTAHSLGRMALQYETTPVYVNGYPLIVPTPEGIDFGAGEVSGSIVGFTYMQLPEEVTPWKKATEGTVMHLSVERIAEDDQPNAPWRHNVLAEEIRNESLEGFIVGVPLTDAQQILQLGPKKSIVTPESILSRERNSNEYSYKAYVAQATELFNLQRLQGNEANQPKLKAIEELVANMTAECPYVGEKVMIDSTYVRKRNPDGKGFIVFKGRAAGVLSHFSYEVYQDVRTKEWAADTMAIIYQEDIAHQVIQGAMSAKQAHMLPGTISVPLSRRHVLYEIDTRGKTHQRD